MSKNLISYCSFIIYNIVKSHKCLRLAKKLKTASLAFLQSLAFTLATPTFQT